MGFFKNECSLPVRISYRLADLAKEIAGGKTAGIKSKLLHFMPRTQRRLQAINVTGNRQQARDADAASKKLRPESESDAKLQKLAASARQKMERIRRKIKELDELPVSSYENSVPRSNSVLQLSNPTFHTKLPFPSVERCVPVRFKTEGKDDKRIGSTWGERSLRNS